MVLTINLDEGTQIGRLIFVKELHDFNGTAALVNDTKSDRFFAISGVIVPFSGGFPEIMIFEADADGEVIDWTEEACWRRERNLDEVMWDFSFALEDEDEAINTCDDCGRSDGTHDYDVEH